MVTAPVPRVRCPPTHLDGFISRTITGSRSRSCTDDPSEPGRAHQRLTHIIRQRVLLNRCVKRLKLLKSQRALYARSFASGVLQSPDCMYHKRCSVAWGDLFLSYMTSWKELPCLTWDKDITEQFNRLRVRRRGDDSVMLKSKLV